MIRRRWFAILALVSFLSLAAIDGNADRAAEGYTKRTATQSAQLSACRSALSIALQITSADRQGAWAEDDPLRSELIRQGREHAIACG